MFAFFGLGNKGAEYENTRHNAGFLALDLLANFCKLSSKEITKFKSLVFNIPDHKILCVKPQTYMNLSGEAVMEVMRFYKIPLENVFVFHDDIDLPLGKIKIKIGGGSGGHNGLKSIDENVGKDYARIRIGVGRPEHKNDVSNFVLNDFTKEEFIEIEAALSKLFSQLDLLLDKKFSYIKL